MTPQAQTVLKHLADHGTLTGIEGEAVYQIRHLPSRIFEIKRHGVAVTTETKFDARGQRYARYSVESV